MAYHGQSMQPVHRSAVHRLTKVSLLTGLAVLVLALYYRGAVQQLTHVNTDMHRTDQSAYMDYARQMRGSDYRYVGDRNRMPVYPFIQSLSCTPDLSPEGHFLRGKYVNLLLSLVVLAAAGAILSRLLGLLAALTLTLITAFTVFIFKAGYFQAELLFYGLNFALFLLMARLLQRPTWPVAILCGGVAALAHLTKASILPGLLLFLLAAAVRAAAMWRHRSATLRQWLIIPLVAACFLLAVYPYIHNSKRVFGRYFYNVNSTFYIWYDSWAEARQGTRAHGDRVGWPDMPPDQIPTLSKYLREHTGAQLLQRVGDGSRRVVDNMAHSYGYFKYILIYLVLFLIACIWRWPRARDAIAQHPVLILFTLTYFAMYFLLYAWYAPIADGNRLILAQFLPLMFVLAAAITHMLEGLSLRAAGRSIPVLAAIHAAVLLILSVDVYFIFTQRITTIYGGC